ncbi:MAG TPA: glycerol-3-phosphate responsive antiterminator [Ktedonobacteraceae bacterium]|jgi:glycerol uptake operon antiterminator
MITQSGQSLLNQALHYKVIPVVESRTQLAQALDHTAARVALLRYCSLFELGPLLESAHRRGFAIWVNVDHIDGINADEAGIQYMARQFHIQGIVSHHPKTLLLSKKLGLETMQRIYAVDSTGLETALESVNPNYVDILNICPALVIPHIASYLKKILPLPFIGSGLISTREQARSIFQAGAAGVTVLRSDLRP